MVYKHQLLVYNVFKMEGVVKMGSKNTIRVNIRLSQKVKGYFENKSNETGVAQSSLMALALEEYIDQKTMLQFAKTVEMLEGNKEGQ